jgi:uncharacterized membrane protein YsdA (DUF1294 family)/cold shock CspA family protein
MQVERQATPSEGVIKTWHEDKGYGFIAAAGQDVFFHARDFRAHDGRRPAAGQRVRYAVVHVGGKGPRATRVEPAGLPAPARAAPAAAAAARPAPAAAARPRRAPAAPQASARPWAGAGLVLPLALAEAAVLAWGVVRGLWPWWLPVVLALLNLGAFLAYWRDKHAARQGHWRISEQSLQAWSLAGGWVGAWVAQQVLRHKSSKGSFLAVYALTVVAHLGAVAAWVVWGPQVLAPWLR